MKKTVCCLLVLGFLLAPSLYAEDDPDPYGLNATYRKLGLPEYDPDDLPYWEKVARGSTIDFDVGWPLPVSLRESMTIPRSLSEIPTWQYDHIDYDYTVSIDRMSYSSESEEESFHGASYRLMLSPFPFSFLSCLRIGYDYWNDEETILFYKKKLYDEGPGSESYVFGGAVVEFPETQFLALAWRQPLYLYLDRTTDARIVLELGCQYRLPDDGRILQFSQGWYRYNTMTSWRDMEGNLELESRIDPYFEVIGFLGGYDGRLRYRLGARVQFVDEQIAQFRYEGEDYEISFDDGYFISFSLGVSFRTWSWPNYKR